MSYCNLRTDKDAVQWVLNNDKCDSATVFWSLLSQCNLKVDCKAVLKHPTQDDLFVLPTTAFVGSPLDHDKPGFAVGVQQHEGEHSKWL